MLDRRRAVAVDSFRRRREHLELVDDFARVIGERTAHRSWRRQLLREQRAATGLVELAVGRAHGTDGEQLGDDAFMHGGVLPQVEAAQVPAERDDLTAHRLDEAVGEGTGAVHAQRVRNDREIVEQFLHRVVGGTGGGRRRDAQRLGAAGELLLGAGIEPPVHAAKCPPIWLVGPER